MSFSLGSGEGGVGGNAALVVGITGHPDVPGKTPGGSPGVLDNPVVLAGGRVRSVPNHQHTVVQGVHVSGTLGRVVHTVAVQLEAEAACIDGNSDRALGGDCISHRSLIIGSDHLVARHGGSHVAGGELAGSIATSVGVRSLSVDATRVLDVLVGWGLEATVAARVSTVVGAVHQVLLGQGNQVVGLQEVSSLDGAYSRECPARPALALVLHRGHSCGGKRKT